MVLTRLAARQLPEVVQLAESFDEEALEVEVRHMLALHKPLVGKGVAFRCYRANIASLPDLTTCDGSTTSRHRTAPETVNLLAIGNPKREAAANFAFPSRAFLFAAALTH